MKSKWRSHCFKQRNHHFRFLCFQNRTFVKLSHLLVDYLLYLIRLDNKYVTHICLHAIMVFMTSLKWQTLYRRCTRRQAPWRHSFFRNFLISIYQIEISSYSWFYRLFIKRNLFCKLNLQPLSYPVSTTARKKCVCFRNDD